METGAPQSVFALVDSMAHETDLHSTQVIPQLHSGARGPRAAYPFLVVHLQQGSMFDNSRLSGDSSVLPSISDICVVHHSRFSMAISFDVTGRMVVVHSTNDS
jgi:hypothetical protein